jgi:hypothetical protein
LQDAASLLLPRLPLPLLLLWIVLPLWLFFFSSSSAKEAIQIDAYGSAVSDTAAVMIAGKSEGTNVDYVVSSQPVVFAAMAKNKNLTIKADIANAFSEKFGTNGFPQAGLFIKKTLSDDTTKKGAIESFLKSYDTDVADLIAGGTATAALMDTYGDATGPAGTLRN